MSNVTIDCPWGQTPDETGLKCELWLTLVPAWEYEWGIWVPIAISGSCFLLVIGYLNRILGIHHKYLANKGNMKPTWRNLSAWSLAVGVIGYLLMGFAYIDGWAFNGRWNLSTYLGLYPIAYGLIGAHVIILKLHFMDEILLAPKRNKLYISKKYSKFVLAIVVLLLAYAIIGFFTFGLVLRGVFTKDQNSQLGEKGNILIYVMYGGIMAGYLFAILPTVIQLVHEYRMSGNEMFIRTAGNLNTWGLAAFILCAANIFQMSYRLSYKPVFDPYIVQDPVYGLLDLANTMLSLEWNRIIEIGFGLNMLNILGSASELLPLISNILTACGVKGLVYEENGTLRHKGTSRTKSGNKSSNKSSGKSSVGLQSEVEDLAPSSPKNKVEMKENEVTIDLEQGVNPERRVRKKRKKAKVHNDTENNL